MIFLTHSNKIKNALSSAVSVGHLSFLPNVQRITHLVFVSFLTSKIRISSYQSVIGWSTHIEPTYINDKLTKMPRGIKIIEATL